MRHFFIKKKQNKRQKLEKDALKNLRQTRQKFQDDHPGMLSKIRLLHEKMEESQKASKSAENTKDIPIDRGKNLETVARFLQITNSETIKKSLKDNLF